MDTLVSQGAPIEGEAGVGYVLQPGYFLPPLVFTTGEVDALVLGLRFAAQRGDPGLQLAADDAVAKIVAVPPKGAGDAAGASLGGTMRRR